MEILNEIRDSVQDVRERVIRIETLDHSDSIKTLRVELKDQKVEIQELKNTITELKTRVAPILAAIAVAFGAIIDFILHRVIH